MVFNKFCFYCYTVGLSKCYCYTNKNRISNSSDEVTSEDFIENKTYMFDEITGEVIGV